MQEKIPVKDLKVGDKVLANYNIEVPGGRGYWYDCIITEVNNFFVNTVFENSYSIFSYIKHWLLGIDVVYVPKCEKQCNIALVP